ncbi:hypothetical protein [Rhizobacter sp. Root1221]|uniref:hypothetical protein n=1 Tax=Rhizobacter sp. Root1221 TaxID=1736433 RepID=UPI0006FF475B|nr:hypothetical protein [Rhizobacter sp. Root1221]KQW03019.1 hypothetical protein ASC87_01405 [Rhizobacter sp. Root1221]
MVPLGAGQPRGGRPPINPDRAAEVLQESVDLDFTLRMDAAENALRDATRRHDTEPGEQTHAALRAAAADLDAALSTSQLRNLAASARMHTATRVRQDFSIGELDRLAPTGEPEDADVSVSQQRQATLDEVARQRPVVQASAEGARQIQAQHDAALDAAEQRLLDLMVLHPPGFALIEPMPDLGDRLQALVDRLPEQSLKEAMPRSAMVEAISRSLAHLTGGDPARAANTLQALMDSPTSRWMSSVEPAADIASDAAEHVKDDVQALFRLMSGVHRGTEVLMLASRDKATIAQVTADSLDVRAYWRADEAQRHESPAVREWLEGAKRVAVTAIDKNPDAAPPTHRDLAAQRAVRMGFLSNEPDSHFGRINKRVTKMITQWVDRAMAAEVGIADRLWQMVSPGETQDTDIEQGDSPAAQASRRQQLDPPSRNPLGKKTPLRSGILQTLDTVGASVGLRTPSVQAREATHAASRALEEAADLHFAHALAEEPAPTVAIAKALGVFMREHPDLGPEHTPSDEEMSTLQAHVREALTGHDVRMPPAETLLSMVRQAGEALQALPGGAEADVAAALESSLAQAEAAEKLLSPSSDGRQRFVDDICAKLDAWDLRTRMRASDGAVAGLGLPPMSILPAAAGTPLVTPVLSGQVRREAFIDIFHPMQGLQITAGSIRQVGGELGLSAGPSFKLAEDVLGLRLSGGIKGSLSSTHAEGAILRIRREPGRLPEMIENLKNVVRDLARWETLLDDRGEHYSDALTALLARHDKLIVSDMAQDVASSTLEMSASAGLSVGDPRKGQRNTTFGPNASMMLSTERQQQSYADNSGHVRVLNEQGSVAQHKFRASASLTANIGDPNNYPRAPHSASAPAPHSAPAPAPSAGVPAKQSTEVTGLRGPLIASGTREFGQSYEKASVTLLDFAGTIDADHDRYYNTPEPLLAEVELNREQWVQRYLETLADWSEQQKQTQGRELAHQHLDRFLEDAQALAPSNFANFNIHDTMMPQAAGHFETLQMLTDVAQATDNEAVVLARKADRDQLLNEPSTWRRSTMNLFERGKASSTTGVNVVLRAGRTQGADAQIQLTEYPPRNPAPPPQA